MMGNDVPEEGVLKGIIRPVFSLVGKMRSDGIDLKGVIKSKANLVGFVSVPKGYSYYAGSYEVTPKIKRQTLATEDKVMAKDLTVKEIPYYEVSNTHGGTTVIIGG